jgi:copper homeostasis protein
MATLEICCTSFASAKIAEENGANRIELCDNILEGGTTPSAGLIAAVKEELEIPVHVLIRPRGGDFVYTEKDFMVMELDIAACLSMGVDGIVSGALNPDGTIDEDRTLTMVEMCREISFTFHRAFDLVPDQFNALDTLNDLGVARVLTSGGMNNVADGAPRIGELIAAGDNEIKIMAGGGLTLNNIESLLGVGCQEFHTTAKNWITTTGNTDVRMNSIKEIPENRFMEASADEIRALITKIEGYKNG